MATLDRNSPIPLYYQLYTILVGQIKSGEYKPGDMLPTEISIITEYNVSRATVRQAVLDLVRNGYVVREKSRGTFVKDYSNTVGYTGSAKYFSAYSSRGGQIPLNSVVLAKAVIDAPKPIQEILCLQPGEKVFYLKRLRYINGEVNTFVEDWLPYKYCEGIETHDFSNEASLYKILEEIFHIVPNHTTRTFESSSATTNEEIQSLEIRKGNSLLRCEGFVSFGEDTPLEYYVALIKGKYTVRI